MTAKNVGVSNPGYRCRARFLLGLTKGFCLVTIEKTFVLPFLPQIGMQLSWDIEHNERIVSGTIKFCHWNQSKDLFEITLLDSQRAYENEDDLNRDVDSMVRDNSFFILSTHKWDDLPRVPKVRKRGRMQAG